ncbi:MAG: arylesterase [Comamonadaceae bacterium]|nr:MAG: arylesterase [Comamonadaceae bacterium]
MPGRRRRLIGLALLPALLPLLAACGKKVRGQPVAAGATVLALGDSITFGLGAAPQESYPEVLAKLTGWKVVNAGISGDTSAQALARLPALLEEHRPALVLVSIGGNDFLRRMPETATRANIRSICQQAKAAGAQVLLVAVPAFSLAAAIGSLSDHVLYAELAEELKLPLHAGGWSTVLADPALRSDAIHGNAQGYARFAQGLAETTRASGMR